MTIPTSLSFKKLCFLIAFVFLTFDHSFCQNLKIPELLQISSKLNWDAVNDYLTQKGWEYYSSKAGDDENYNTVTWAYQKNRYDDKAQGWFYLFTYTGAPNKIAYSFRNKQTFMAIKNSLSTNGFKSVGSEIKDESIVSKYSNQLYNLTLSYRARQEDDYSDVNYTSYYITLIKKSGVYDEDNGLKKNYDHRGNLTTEYTLKDGKMNGIGKSYYANGMIKVSVNFVNDKKNGVSFEYDDDGSKTGEFTYKDGILNGPYKVYEDGKLVLICNMVNDVKEGLFKEYDSDGNLEREYTKKANLFQGTYIEYYYKANKLFVKTFGSFVDDLKVGLWQTVKVNEKGNEVLESHFYNNGEVEGAFKEVRGDSIIVGEYKNGVLHGDCRIYTSLTRMLFGEVSGDTSNSVLISKGRYYSGKKTGNWKNFSISRTLKSEGNFAAGEKTGEWRYYYDSYVKPLANEKTSVDEPYSKKLFLIANYENGQKNGKSIRYSYLEETKQLCDTSIYKNKSPLDSCYNMKFTKVYETSYYKDGMLQGPFESKDSTGKIILKGTFANDEREGLWYEYLTNEPSYFKFNYSNGQLNGQTYKYATDNRIEEEMIFSNGALRVLNIYDSLGNQVRRAYEIIKDNPESIICRETIFEKDGKASQEYYVSKENGINWLYFDLEFQMRVGNGKDGYENGPLLYSDHNGNPRVSGMYQNGKKVGTWKYYYYDIDVVRAEDQSENATNKESFTSIKTGMLYSGHFIQKFQNGEKKYDIKVEKGLRHGKSKFFDEKGELVKIEKYKDGTLLND